MANYLALCIVIGVVVVMVIAAIIAYWRLIVYRRNLRRRYGRRAGVEPPCWCYDALPMCFAGQFATDGDHCKPCDCFMKYEPDPDAPPAAAYIAAKREDTSRVPEIGNQPPPSYDVIEMSRDHDDVTEEPNADYLHSPEADKPPSYDVIQKTGTP